MQALGHAGGNEGALAALPLSCHFVTEAPAFSAPLDELGERNWPAHKVAKAAVNAVLNRWGDGPDEELRLAAVGVRMLYREWAALPVGGTLRATWPVHDSWLRLL